MCTPNNRAQKYTKLTELKGEGDEPTITDFSSPLSVTDRPSRWRTTKEIDDLDGTVSQLDLTPNNGSIDTLLKGT